MTKKIVRAYSRDGDRLLDSAKERGATLWTSAISVVCERTERARRGMPATWSWGAQQPTYLVEAPTEAAAINLLRKHVRPSVRRGARTRCTVKFNVYKV